MARRKTVESNPTKDGSVAESMSEASDGVLVSRRGTDVRNPAWFKYGFACLVLLVALWLRTAVFTQSLWYDECLTARVSESPFIGSVTEVMAHNSRHLPLYYWMNHILLWFVHCDWASRILALVFGLGALPVLYSLARRLARVEVACLAVLFLVISPLHMFNSSDAREYSLLLLACLLATDRLLVALDSRKRRDWILFCLATTLSLYTSFFAFLSLLGHGVFVVLIQGETLAKKRRLSRDDLHLVRDFVISGLASVLLFLPMLPVMTKWLGGDLVSSTTAETVAVSMDWDFLRRTFSKFGGGLGYALWVFGFGFFSGVVIAFFKNRRLFYLVTGLFLAGLGPFFYILPHSRIQVFSTRYIIFLLPIFLLVTSYGFLEPIAWGAELAGRGDRAKRLVRYGLGIAVVAALALVTWASLPAIKGTMNRSNENWRGVCQFIARHGAANDAIVLQREYAGYMFGYYGRDLGMQVYPCTNEGLDALDKVCGEHPRVWYVGTWGSPDANGAEKLARHNFMTLFDQSSQGVLLALSIRGMPPARKSQVQLSWRVAAYNELKRHPFMSVWLARAYREAGDKVNDAKYMQEAIDGYASLSRTDAWILTQASLHVSNLVEYGDILRETRNFALAREAYAEALWLWPDKENAIYSLACMERDAGNPIEGGQYLAQYFRQVPNHPVWMNDMCAQMFLSAGSLEAAFMVYKDVYAQANKNGDAEAPRWWLAGADLLAGRDDKDGAMRELASLVQTHPGYVQGRVHLANLLKGANDVKQAAQIVRDGLAINPNDSTLLGLQQSLK